jgi:hypothetical protein
MPVLERVQLKVLGEKIQDAIAVGRETRNVARRSSFVDRRFSHFSACANEICAPYSRMNSSNNFDCTPPMPVISQRIFDAIIRYASGEKVRSELLGYGDDEFLPWPAGAVM